MLCAVVGVAHLVTTSALKDAELGRARAAAELASLTAPHEEIPRLDLAAVTAAEGHTREAERILSEDVCDRDDEGEAPMELSERTESIIASHDWLPADPPGTRWVSVRRTRAGIVTGQGLRDGTSGAHALTCDVLVKGSSCGIDQGGVEQRCHVLC